MLKLKGYGFLLIILWFRRNCIELIIFSIGLNILFEDYY